VRTVAVTKGLGEADVLRLLDAGLQGMDEYVDAGLVTGVKYEGEIVDDLKRRFRSKGPDEDDAAVLKRPLDAVPFAQYARRTSEKMLGLGGRQKIAVIRAAGAITSGKSGSSPVMGNTIGSESIVGLLNDAADDDSIKAVVMRVDSPGGSALASDVMFHAVGRLAKKKPVIASMVSVAASGGYYISMGCPIVCEPAALSGSVGVVTAKLSLGELYKRVGFAKETLSRGKYAELEIDTRVFNRDEAAYFKSGAERAYRSFVTKAAAARGLDYDTMHAVAQGRVWTGQQAAENGLVDHLGGFWRAVELAKDAAGITDEHVCLEEVRAPVSTLARLGLGGAAAEAPVGGRIARMIAGGEPLALCDVDAATVGASGACAMQSPLQRMLVEAMLHASPGGAGAALQSVFAALLRGSV
jgi:protease IV